MPRRVWLGSAKADGAPPLGRAIGPGKWPRKHPAGAPFGELSAAAATISGAAASAAVPDLFHQPKGPEPSALNLTI